MDLKKQIQPASSLCIDLAKRFPKAFAELVDELPSVYFSTDIEVILPISQWLLLRKGVWERNCEIYPSPFGISVATKIIQKKFEEIEYGQTKKV